LTEVALPFVGWTLVAVEVTTAVKDAWDVTCSISVAVSTACPLELIAIPMTSVRTKIGRVVGEMLPAALVETVV
jgi:hypothetical protein